MTFSFSFMQHYWPLFVQGSLYTLLMAVITVVAGTVMGTGWAIARLSRHALPRLIATAYIEFLRGTPLLVQVMLIYYGLPMMGIKVPVLLAGCVGLSLNSAAYVAEIVRSGIQSIDRGQSEAARSLGMTSAQTMSRIILPQAIRNILPALGNEFVVVIKESSIASTIGAAELMYNTKTIGFTTMRYVEALIVTSVLYFVMTFTTSRLLGLVERRLRAGER